MISRTSASVTSDFKACIQSTWTELNCSVSSLVQFSSVTL